MRNRPRTIKLKPKSDYGPVTIALCVVFGVVFLFESYVDGGGLWRISAQTAGRLGANAGILTLGQEEYWRLLTATLLHGGLIHVGFNTYAMLIIGSALEKTLGPGWVVGPFAFSGLTGSLLSAFANTPNVPSLGASGGIFGLVAMAAAISFLAPRLVGFSRNVLVQWLIFALAIGFVAGFDNWGHIGGIVGGGLAALPAIGLKDRPEVVQKLGYAFGAVGALALVAAVVLGAPTILASISSGTIPVAR